MDRAKFLMIYGANLSNWASRYGLSPFSVRCTVCKSFQVVGIPFTYGELRGLIAKECACGNPPPYRVVHFNGGDILAAMVRMGLSNETSFK